MLAALTRDVPADFLPFIVGMSISAQPAPEIQRVKVNRLEFPVHSFDGRFLYHNIGIVWVSILDTAWNSFPP